MYFPSENLCIFRIANPVFSDIDGKLVCLKHLKIILMKYRIKNTWTTVLVIAFYQILGGVTGLGLTVWLLLKTQTINGAMLLIFLTAIGLYSFSINSGITLIQKDYRKGLIFSIVNQIIQVVAIGSGNYSFQYFSGSKAAFGFDFTNGFTTKFQFGLLSEFNFGINQSDKEYFLYINIMAIVLLYILFDLYKEIVLRKILNPETRKNSSEVPALNDH
jgi:hypothetical protein